MELYIEIDVLDKLNKDFLNENLSIGQRKFFDILEFYAEIKLCTNFSFSDTEFDKYKLENPLFTKIMVNAVLKSYSSLRDFIDANEFKQTIVLVLKENFRERDSVENRGGLYFTYDSYSEKIEKIVTHFHKKVDLSEIFQGWHKILTSNILKLNEIIINDNYLLDSTLNFETYIKPIVNAVKKQSSLDRVLFITDFLNKRNFDKVNKEKVLKKILNSRIEMIHNNFNNFSNHDRVLYTNFLMIDCPIGFNQTHRASNSLITIQTVFDKFTYNRRRRHLRLFMN